MLESQTNVMLPAKAGTTAPSATPSARKNTHRNDSRIIRMVPLSIVYYRRRCGRGSSAAQLRHSSTPIANCEPFAVSWLAAPCGGEVQLLARKVHFTGTARHIREVRTRGVEI